MTIATNQISINPMAIARALAAVAIFLIFTGVAAQLIKIFFVHDRFKGLIGMFDLDDETNLPSFFSTVILFIASLLLALITVLNKKRNDLYVWKWAILSLGFLFLAFDEVASIHERLGRPMRNLLGTEQLGIFHFAWVIPGIAVVGFLAIFFLKFIFYLPSKTRFNFLLAGFLYVGGAIGFELIGGSYTEAHGRDVIYMMLSTTEESLEMGGIIFFIWSLLVYISDNFKEVQFQFNGSDKS